MKATENDVTNWYYNTRVEQVLTSPDIPWIWSKTDIINFHNWMEEKRVKEIVSRGDLTDYARTADYKRISSKEIEACFRNLKEVIAANKRIIELDENRIKEIEAIWKEGNKQPEPSPKMEFYDMIKSKTSEEIRRFISNQKGKLISSEKLIIEINDYINTAEYIISERANEIKVGDRYRRIDNGCSKYIIRIFTVKAIIDEHVWLHDITEVVSPVSISTDELKVFYTKLPKDGE